MRTTYNIIIIILGLSFFLASCSGMDEYLDKYTNGNEIRYAGKPVEVEALPGNGRIGIRYLLGPDVALDRTVIYWSNKADSVTLKIDRDKLSSDVISTVIENLPEGSYSFELVNFDYFGNKSVPEYVVGHSYGTRYSSVLTPRSVVECAPVNFQKDVQVVFTDSINNSVGVELSYISDGSEVTVYMKNDAKENTIELPRCDITNPIRYRTMYKPDIACIDTFYTQWEEVYSIDKMLIKKPYAYITLTGDAPAEYIPNSWNNLWDDRAQTTWKKYNEIGYSNFTTTGSHTAEAIWATIDVRQRIDVARVRADYYYYKEGTAPKILDLLAYTGEGVPPSLEPEDPTYWKDWLLIHTYDNSDPNEYPFDANDAITSQVGFAKGLDVSFEYQEVPKAQYFRLKCRAAWTPWNQNSKNFSLSEITFWTYMY
ncbi:DUF4998 domain-containing protein [Bacteroides sp.]|uniref:DUF4998 domain-containing protein n=1 Tax=Bacteroides sp. TaxID=29523 RepID=UPI002616CEAC|nr:DUF4998 domain-containing protein [Bacteroides sp.]MDD3038016.1 DUF4998 domain-containing protein [Bacteroides sp.]